MFNSISWQSYWTNVILISAGWYAYVLLRHYRPELMKRFKPKAEPLPLVSSAPVMGSIRTDQATLDPEELHFGSNQPDDISDHSLPPGPAGELFNEAQTLIQAFRETPNKIEFLSLLELLLSKYEPYKDEIDLKVIRPLAAQLPFNIEDQEWPEF
jgi:hypothetical protein